MRLNGVHQIILKKQINVSYPTSRWLIKRLLWYLVRYQAGALDSTGLICSQPDYLAVRMDLVSEPRKIPLQVPLLLNRAHRQLILSQQPLPYHGHRLHRLLRPSRMFFLRVRVPSQVKFCCTKLRVTNGYNRVYTTLLTWWKDSVLCPRMVSQIRLVFSGIHISICCQHSNHNLRI